MRYVLFQKPPIRLTNQQQKELLWKYRNNGDQQALEKLVLSFSRLIMRTANRIANLNWMIEDIQKEDLAQEGLEGLVKAINAFKDPRPETNFMSFASRYIKGRMWQYVRNAGVVRRNICNITRDTRGKIFYQLATLVDIVMTWDPDLKEEKRQEFSNKINVPLSIIVEAEKRWTISSTELTTEHGAQQESFSDGIDLATLQQVVDKAMLTLKDEHKYLVNDRFFSDTPRTLNQLSKELGIHRNTVDQRFRYALSNLKQTLSESQVVREFLT